MDPRPIPAFYCCYVLRSTVRRSSLYVGSTPNPIRRLAQHNGVTKGGAVKTSRDSLRPWEMACIVSGFPSHIAALQFEWAWQNTHLTRHIPGPQRITEAHSSVRISPKTGRTRRRPARPRICLTDKISNLHLLLRVDSFARWPLEVRFFCEDVYKVWKRWNERVDGRIRDGIQIILDCERFEETARAEDPDALPASNQAQAPKVDGTLRGGIKAVDVTYAATKSHVEKSQAQLADSHQARCSVCQKALEKQTGLLTTCPRPDCASISHMACLSSHLIASQGQHDMVLPVEGSCPTCNSQIKWIDVVKELSLRAYGQKELTKLLKKPREMKVKVPRTKKAKKGRSSVDSDLEPDADEQDNDDAAHTTEEEEMNVNAADINLQGWANRELEDGDDAMSLSSLTSLGSEDPVSHTSPSKVGFAARQRPEIVIEDSDWDDAEVLD